MSVVTSNPSTNSKIGIFWSERRRRRRKKKERVRRIGGIVKEKIRRDIQVWREVHLERAHPRHEEEQMMVSSDVSATCYGIRVTAYMTGICLVVPCSRDIYQTRTVQQPGFQVSLRSLS